MISPDDYMDRPVDSLVYGCAQYASRAIQWVQMLAEKPRMANEPNIAAILAKDEQMRVAYIVSMRLRAYEVASYIVRTTGMECYPYEVEDAPLAVALAWWKATEQET